MIIPLLKSGISGMIMKVILEVHMVLLSTIRVIFMLPMHRTTFKSLIAMVLS